MQNYFTFQIIKIVYHILLLFTKRKIKTLKTEKYFYAIADTIRLSTIH